MSQSSPSYLKIQSPHLTTKSTLPTSHPLFRLRIPLRPTLRTLLPYRPPILIHPCRLRNNDRIRPFRASIHVARDVLVRRHSVVAVLACLCSIWTCLLGGLPFAVLFVGFLGQEDEDAGAVAAGEGAFAGVEEPLAHGWVKGLGLGKEGCWVDKLVYWIWMALGIEDLRVKIED
jgi:hypothetical protein